MSDLCLKSISSEENSPLMQISLANTNIPIVKSNYDPNSNYTCCVGTVVLINKIWF